MFLFSHSKIRASSFRLIRNESKAIERARACTPRARYLHHMYKMCILVVYYVLVIDARAYCIYRCIVAIARTKNAQETQMSWIYVYANEQYLKYIKTNEHILIWQIKNRSAIEGDFDCTRACVYIFSFSFHLIGCDFCVFFFHCFIIEMTTKREQFELNKYKHTHIHRAHNMAFSLKIINILKCGTLIKCSMFENRSQSMFRWKSITVICELKFQMNNLAAATKSCTR